MNYLKTKLQEQIGSKITKSSAGGGVGSTWKIEFNNSNFFFFHCSWRLVKNELVLITSQDSVDPKGLISTTTPIKIGKEIENIILYNNCDLSINISDKFRLDIFCDMGPGFELYDDATNWDLCIPSEDKAICINNKFKMIEEKYY